MTVSSSSSSPPPGSPVWAVPRGTEGVRIMVEGGVAEGMTVARCLDGTGIAPADLHDEHAQIWAHQEFAVIRNLLAGLGAGPGLGARIGAHSTIGRTGVFGFMLLAGPTVQAAIDRVIPYLALSPTHLRFALEVGGGGAAAVRADDDEIPADVRAFVVERDLAGLAAAFEGAQIHLGVTGLETTLGPDAALLVGQAWGLGPDALTPGAATNRLVVAREVLETRLPQGDENTARLFEQQCREVLDARLARVGVAGQVRSRLRHEREVWPSMDDAAADLHLDVRTLRRRLTAEGTSFRRLLDEVRHGRALELLAQGASVAEVARELGYSETATFTRTFTRWEGVPPSRLRVRERGQERYRGQGL